MLKLTKFEDFIPGGMSAKRKETGAVQNPKHRTRNTAFANSVSSTLVWNLLHTAFQLCPSLW